MNSSNNNNNNNKRMQDIEPNSFQETAEVICQGCRDSVDQKQGKDHMDEPAVNSTGYQLVRDSTECLALVQNENA